MSVDLIPDLILEDDYFKGIYKLYPEMKEIVVIDSWSSKEFIKEVEKYFDKQGIEIHPDEDLWIDDNEGIVYHRVSDFLTIDGEILGRHSFEEGDYTFDSSLAEYFTNKPDLALPEWFKEEWIKSQGFEKKSCEFDIGMYAHSRNDDPKELIKKANDKGLDIIFQIDYVNPFEVGFCAWTKKH